MTREDINQEIISKEGNNLIIELPTGTGKTKIAIDKVKEWNKDEAPDSTLLIVVPRNVLKQTWKEELEKWWPDCKLLIHYTTYVSLPKCKGTWDYCIMDEGHHLSERCREALCDFNIAHSLICSATIGKQLKDELKEIFDGLNTYKKNLRDVIENNILPDPKVYLVPLELNNTTMSEVIFRNPKLKGRVITCTWAERWKYFHQKTNPVKIYCTEKQYISDLDSQIDYWKRKYSRTNSPIAKNKWLRLCSERLKWLSSRKENVVSAIQQVLSEYRTLTFCNNIEQTKKLGKYCINSKNKYSKTYLESFNKGRINHITACNVLNEGVNLVNCQVGIYANLNSSETIIKQRTGRLLRHPNPVIVIPYFKDTRDEELVSKMLENYNMDLVIKTQKLDEIVI